MDLLSERKKKLKELKELNIIPYEYKFDKKHNSKQILDNFSKFKNKKVSIAGRIMTQRIMGGASFAHIQDGDGQIQIYINKSVKNYDLFKKLDIGDIIGVKGKVFKTKKGEISVEVNSFQLLTKSLRPLPEKWHGLKDKEIRYRQRYVDLIMNQEVKEVFRKRALTIQAMREFLIKNGYIEVETPILQPIYGGTNARPFESKLNALNMKVYMRISNELYLKRLIVGGYEKIFEFSQDFRNEGVDKTHNPEFLLMETMCAYANYEDNMDFVEEMFEFIAKKVNGTTKVTYQGRKIDFKRPWKRMRMVDAIKEFAKIDIENMSDEEIKKFMEKNNLKLETKFSRGFAMELIFEELVEKNLIQPTIIYDYPFETCGLAKPKKDNPDYAERFEPYVNGWELGNIYSELNDPEILRAFWKKQEKKNKEEKDKEAQRMDEDFLRALEYGMPPTSGVGIGVDRLVMLLTNSESIRDVIFFPFMRPE